MMEFTEFNKFVDKFICERFDAILDYCEGKDIWEISEGLEENIKENGTIFPTQDEAKEFFDRTFKAMIHYANVYPWDTDYNSIIADAVVNAVYSRVHKFAEEYSWYRKSLTKTDIYILGEALFGLIRDDVED